MEVFITILILLLPNAVLSAIVAFIINIAVDGMKLHIRPFWVSFFFGPIIALLVVFIDCMSQIYKKRQQ